MDSSRSDAALLRFHFEQRVAVPEHDRFILSNNSFAATAHRRAHHGSDVESVGPYGLADADGPSIGMIVFKHQLYAVFV